MSFRVLFVCTGNICRSPTAELLMRAYAGGSGSGSAAVAVSSAGVRALVGEGIDTGSGAALVQLGVDPSGHRARQFERWMAAEADLVLTAERLHRDIVMREVPNAFRRTFTLKEFVALTADVRADDPVTAVATASANRAYRGPVDAADDDIRDPYQGQLSQAAAVADEIADAVRATLSALGLATGRTPEPAADGPVER